MTSHSSPVIHRHWPALGPCTRAGDRQRVLAGGREMHGEAVAEAMGVTASGAYQIEKRALEKLKARLDSLGITYADLAPERGDVPEEYEVRG